MEPSLQQLLPLKNPVSVNYFNLDSQLIRTPQYKKEIKNKESENNQNSEKKILNRNSPDIPIPAKIQSLEQFVDASFTDLFNFEQMSRLALPDFRLYSYPDNYLTEDFPSDDYFLAELNTFPNEIEDEEESSIKDDDTETIFVLE